MSSSIKEDIVRFEITVNYAPFMKEREAARDFCDPEAYIFLGETAFHIEVI